MSKIIRQGNILAESNDTWTGTKAEYEAVKETIPFGTKIVITDGNNKGVFFMPDESIDPLIQTGAKGDPGISIRTASVNQQGNLILTLTDNTQINAGKVVGADGADGKSVTSVTKTKTEGLVDTYTVTYTDGTTNIFTVSNGANGQDGKGIKSVTKTATVENIDTYTIKYTDNSTTTFTVTNGINGAAGAAGRGIKTIAKTGSSGKIDTYTITYTDDATTTFLVTNGNDGRNGNDGVGIESIALQGHSGNVDTYVIQYTNDTSTTFNVTNGINGVDGNDGSDGISIVSAVVNGQGELVLTLSDGNTINAGEVKGKDGTSINIIDSLSSSSQLPSTGQVKGDSYLISGDLWVYTNSSDPDAVNGFKNVGRIQGPAGKGIVSANITDGKLYLTYSDSATPVLVGDVRGDTGKGISTVAKTGSVGLVDTYTITYTDSTTSTFTVVNGANGATGAAGRSVTNIAKTGSAGLVDTYTITYSDSTTSTYTVTNGADGQDGQDGVGIASFAKTGSVGLVDTYTITYTDGNTDTFTVTNGKDGEDGSTGETGVGIVSVTKTNTSGLIDTYTITFSDSTTTTFNITNGANGSTGAAGRGIQGIAKSGTAGNVDTYTVTLTDGTTTTFDVTNGTNGANGISVTNATINSSGELIFTFSAGDPVNVGRVVGNNGISVSKIEKTDTEGLVDTYTITFSNDTTTTFNVTNGATGATGKGIQGIAKTGTTGLTDTYTITYTDNTTSTYTVVNGAVGATGKGITDISYTSTSGLEDTYTITYTDGDTDTFVVTNGATGATGRGVTNITKTGEAGLVDTYTITYSDSTTSTFSVTNGSNGSNGADGDDGRGIVSIAKTSTSGLVDTYTITYTDSTTSTFTVTNGADGASGGIVQRYVPKYAHREWNDIYFEAQLDPGNNYIFDCTSYTWVGVQPKDSTGANTRGELGHNGQTTRVEFTAASNETQCQMRFYPGEGVEFDQVDWTKISFIKVGETAAECSGHNAADIERLDGSAVQPPKQSTNIIDILEGATQANPVQITLMGDSITNGYSADSGKSWAALLEAYIESKYQYVTVVNTGVSGWKSSDAVSNLETALPSGTTVAIAMFGTNNRQSQEYMNALYGDYTTMYNRAKSMGAKFIPMCCTAETLVNESITAKYVATMDAVERIIAKWAVDHNMEMINLYEGLLKYCKYDSDAFDMLFNQTETTTVGGVTYPFHIHPNNDGHYIMYRLICEALGCNAPVSQYTPLVGGTKYLHRIYLYRKGYYYIGFDLYTTSGTSFQGDTQETFNALAAEFTAQNFTNFSWRSIPHVTGWYRESSDGAVINIGAIYYDGTDFVGIREGISLTTFANATIKLTNMKSFTTAPKGAIFDNNIISIG